MDTSPLLPPTDPLPESRGRYLPYSLPRRWVGDMLYSARKVPVIACERVIRVKAMHELRRKTPRPPSWSSLMIKAMGIISMKMPELRRAYLGFPWGRLYEAPYSVASIIFSRQFRGEEATFFAPMLHPEQLSVDKIGAKVNAWKTDPIEAHGALRRLVRNAKPPRPIRRAMWWFGLNWFGLMRARYFGTFAVNSVASIGGRMLQFATPLTQVLYYGAVNRDGEMLIQFAFDHRVYDGITVAVASVELEKALNNELIEEVKNLPALRAATGETGQPPQT